MKTFIKAKLKKSDDQMNIEKNIDKKMKMF